MLLAEQAMLQLADGWDFEGCEGTGCHREQLYDQVCDKECDNELCHWDNWRCTAVDEFQLYDRAGHGWDHDLPLCYETGCTESLLFNSICDQVCDSEECHFDNYMCEDVFVEMSQMGGQPEVTRWADRGGRADRREF